MKSTNNPFEGLGIRYPEASYSDGCIKQKAFFELDSDEAGLIPLEVRIKTLAQFVFEGYDMHELVDNYLKDEKSMDDDTRKHCITRTFKNYADEIFFKPTNDVWRVDIVKALIGLESQAKKDQMREAIKLFIEVVNVYLKKEDFIKPHELPVYLFRTNYYQKDSYKNVETLIDDLHENNILSINVIDKNGDDEKYIEALLNGNVKTPKTPDYIVKFCDLVEKIKTNDILVVAYFVGKKPKLGLIKKGSTFFCKTEEGEVYKLYCFQMTNVINISDKNKIFLDTLIPLSKTISQIQDREEVIRSIYYGMPLPFKLCSLSDSNLEKMCAEYLRSHFSYKLVKVLGKQYPNIDIFGYNCQDELFAAQVSRAKSKETIEKKIEKLCSSFLQAKHKIMFSTNPTDENSNPMNINIQDVWDYFSKDESGKKYLEQLIE